MEFYLPASNGEWLAWLTALITLFFGVILLFAPRLSLKVLRLNAPDLSSAGLSSVRALIAGPYIGMGLACLLFAQPFLWLALACVWASVLFGRLLSILTDKGSSLYNIIAVSVEFLLMAAPMAYVFGLVA